MVELIIPQIKRVTEEEIVIWVCGCSISGTSSLKLTEGSPFVLHVNMQSEQRPLIHLCVLIRISGNVHNHP